ncbi:hypothetical protein ACGFIW_01180 [Micromonospora sp. NPDC048935]|uniref:hypothetical protein n=1 Tax=Micromonospora sp. NPDC048935 TaxID=3364262 RepID=UPI003717B9B0
MADQRYEIRPLGPWTGPVTRNRQSGSAFRAPWSATLDLIAKETLLLGARLVVIQVDVTAADLRRDGMLRANARVGFPGVKVSFESKHGPLTYATDEYAHWQANVRAVALSLQALRAVDRYGVSKSGEQYRGWTALPSGSPSGQMTADDAARLLAGYADAGVTAERVLSDAEVRRAAFRQASRQTHPDHGGDGEAFARVTAARDLLDTSAGAGR